jgi:L-amino acid N-acyltransferase YncA
MGGDASIAAAIVEECPIAGPVRMKNAFGVVKRFVLGLRRPSKAANLRQLRQRGESLEGVVIRDANRDDIPVLAALHVKTWSDTYPLTLHPPTYQIRERQWQQQFDKTDGSWFCFVVENGAGELIGFAKGTTYASDDLPGYAGELNKIYVLRQYQMGIGRRLVGHVARRFLNQGISTMVLFGVPENPSCAFHEAMGGERLYAKNGEFHGGYGWRDVHDIVKRTGDVHRETT